MTLYLDAPHDVLIIISASETFTVPKDVLVSSSAFISTQQSGKFASSRTVDLTDFSDDTVRMMLDGMTIKYLQKSFESFSDLNLTTKENRRFVRSGFRGSEYWQLGEYLQYDFQGDPLRRAIMALKTKMALLGDASDGEDHGDDGEHQGGASDGDRGDEGEHRGDAVDGTRQCKNGAIVDGDDSGGLNNDGSAGPSCQLATELQLAADAHKPSSKDEDLIAAMRISEEETIVQENADVARALLESKDADGVVVLRLSRRSTQIVTLLLESPCLADIVARVRDAGCEVLPSWAGGAVMLIPMTRQQVDESGMELKPYNVVASSSSQELIKQALMTLPKRQRSNVRVESTHDSQRASHGARSSDAFSSDDDISVVVEKTFIHYPVMKDVPELSMVTQTAPCDSEHQHEPVNPRRWSA